MRYASIRSMDVSNGEGIGVSIFVQGCPIHCKGCFNEKTWDFAGGKEWNDESENKLIALAKKPYIKRLSILGGEPLAEENVKDVQSLINRFREEYPLKKVWLYTGYTWDVIMKSTYTEIYHSIRQSVCLSVDYLVDGPYIDEMKDMTLPFRGSSNQRIIDVKESVSNKFYPILYTPDL